MKNYLMISAIFIATLFGCEKDEAGEEQEPSKKEYSINGLIQKGPFVNGTNITVSELNINLSETGRTFHSTITNDKGSFEISNIELETSFVHIRADGYFFNEVNGNLSDSRIVLNAIVDISNNQNININIITSIESERVKYLVENGEVFENAKIQARNEVYSIFGFSNSNYIEPETFDITGSGNDNSMLLAISVIALGTHTGAELTNLISEMSTDLKEDGVLNGESVKSELINEATLLDNESIKANLLSKYQDLGESISINNFEQYVNQFINSSDFTFTKNISYPNEVNGYLNVLSDTTINYQGGVKYCIAAYLPEGTKCRVIYKEQTINSGIGIFPMENNGWDINYVNSDSTNISAVGKGEIVSIPVQQGPPAYIDFYIYENDSEMPTFTKIIGYE